MALREGLLVDGRSFGPTAVTYQCQLWSLLFGASASLFPTTRFRLGGWHVLVQVQLSKPFLQTVINAQDEHFRITSTSKPGSAHQSRAIQRQGRIWETRLESISCAECFL